MDGGFCTRHWSGALTWEQTEFKQVDFYTFILSTAKPIASLLERFCPLTSSFVSFFFTFSFPSLTFPSLSLSPLPFPSPLINPPAGLLVLVHTENPGLENSTQGAFNHNASHVVIEKILRTIMLFKIWLLFNALVSLPLCFRLNITQIPAKLSAFSPIIWKAQRTVLTSKPSLMTKDTWPLQTQASLSSSLHLAKSYFHLSLKVTKD